MRAILSVLFLGLVGCQPALREQGRIRPFEATTAFDNHSTARPRPAGTVSRTYDSGPEPELSLEGLRLGRQKYEIHCEVCHGMDGQGNGMAVQRGFPQPPPLDQPVLLRTSTADLFKDISDGIGTMLGFSNRLSARERWQIAQYLRALQLRLHFPAKSLNPDERIHLGAE